MNGYWTLRRLLGYARNDTEAGYIMGRDDTQVVPYGGWGSHLWYPFGDYGADVINYAPTEPDQPSISTCSLPLAMLRITNGLGAHSPFKRARSPSFLQSFGGLAKLPAPTGQINKT